MTFADVELTTPNSWSGTVKPAMVIVSLPSVPAALPEPYVISKEDPVELNVDEAPLLNRLVERQEDDVQDWLATQRSAEPVSKMR